MVNALKRDFLRHGIFNSAVFSREKLNKIQMTNKYDSIRFLLISQRRCTEDTKQYVTQYFLRKDDNEKCFERSVMQFYQLKILLTFVNNL